MSPRLPKPRWRRQVARALRSLRPCARGSAGGTFFAATSHPSKPCRLTCRRQRSRCLRSRAIEHLCHSRFFPRPLDGHLAGRRCEDGRGQPIGTRGRACACGRTVRRRGAGAPNSDRGGGLAGSIPRFFSRTTYWPTLLCARYASPHPATGRAAYPNPGCRPCVRVRGTWFDARVYPRPGACCLEAPGAHPGSRTGSGILAMAAARLLHRAVLATDIEPWSICVAKQNTALNRLGRLVRVRLANGWRNRAVRASGPYDLVLANILARPLCLMARQLALNLAPGATVILGGLLRNQLRSVLAAHLRCGLRFEASLEEGPWATLILRQSIGKKGRKAQTDRRALVNRWRQMHRPALLAR